MKYYLLFLLHTLRIITPAGHKNLRSETRHSPLADDFLLVGDPSAPAISLPSASQQQNDTVSCPRAIVDIVAEPPMQEGLFGMVFERVLQLLPYSTPATPLRFYPQQPCYGNPLQQLFVDSLDKDISACGPFQKQEVSFEDAFRNGWATGLNEMHSFSRAHALWASRFTLSQSVREKVDAATSRFPSDGAVLGIHYRGTDKYLESRPVAPDDMLLFVKDHVQRNKNIAAIFLATDDARFVQLMENSISQLVGDDGQALRLLTNAATRSTDKSPVHKSACAQGMAEEAMLDMLVLSHCDQVLKTASQLSAWAKIFNPRLPIVRINALYNAWFPDAAIPLYTPVDAPEEIKGKLQQLQDGDLDQAKPGKISGWGSDKNL